MSLFITKFQAVDSKDCALALDGQEQCIAEAIVEPVNITGIAEERINGTAIEGNANGVTVYSCKRCHFDFGGERP